MPTPEISPQELSQRLRAPAEQWPLLLDVRSQSEHDFVSFPHSLHIPLMELEERTDELKAKNAQEIIVYCHHGIRSMQGAAFLRQLGFNARNLTGGIDLYAVSVDRTMRRY